jgi:DUF971 family protein
VRLAILRQTEDHIAEDIEAAQEQLCVEFPAIKCQGHGNQVRRQMGQVHVVLAVFSAADVNVHEELCHHVG